MTTNLTDDLAARFQALVPSTAPHPTRRMLGALVGDIARRERPPIRSYATGMVDLDRLLGGGISTRQLTTVLGPPGNGKSQWCVALAVRLAGTLATLYVSTELEADELAARIAAVILGVPWRDIVRGHVDRARIQAVLADLRIRVVGCDELPTDGTLLHAIAETAIGMVEEYGAPPLVIVDYTQDLARGADERSLRAKVGDVATNLRKLAQVCDCPLVAVSSVSRAYYNERRREEMRAAQDPTIYLAAAKESGDVDYASAVVLFLDVEPAGLTPYRLAQVAVAKSRHGETGFAGARFYGATGRWESDLGAVEALNSETRADERRADRLSKRQNLVLAKVAKLRALPMDHETRRTQLLSKSDLKAAVHGNTAENLAAINALIESGRLVDREECYTSVTRDKVHRVSKRKVIDLADQVAAAPLFPDLTVPS